MASAAPSLPSPSTDLSVLIIGDDYARLDQYVPPLRRASFAVRRVLIASSALQLVRESPFDLLVVVLPFSAVGALLKAVRTEGAPCRRTAVIAIAHESLDTEATSMLGRHANRVLPPSTSPDDLRVAAEQLLRAAPRISVNATARIQVGQGTEARTLPVENLSTTGMLLIATDPPQPGAIFGFEVTIPSFDAPLRGQAQVVRHTARKNPGECGVAVSFLSFGGDGAKRLEGLIFQQRAASGVKQWSAEQRAQAGTATPAAAGRVVSIRDAEELALRREEFADLEPFLEDLLKQGLGPRVRAADWYVAAAELGLDSLRSFSGILEAVHGGQTRNSAVSQQIADLAEVRKNLGDFAGPKQPVEERIRILLQMRRSLERLLRALAITGAFGETEQTGSRPRGLVAELALEIHRLQRLKESVGHLPRTISKIGRTRYIFAPGMRRRMAEEVHKEFSTTSAELELESPETLLSRQGRRKVTLAAHRETRKLEQRLVAVHQKVYAGPFRNRASADRSADFLEAKLIPILVETLAAGSAFLVRAYSAYRHALELTGSDPRLLDRVAGLAASIREAEDRLERRNELTGSMQRLAVAS